MSLFANARVTHEVRMTLGAAGVVSTGLALHIIFATFYLVMYHPYLHILQLNTCETLRSGTRSTLTVVRREYITFIFINMCIRVCLCLPFVCT